MLATSLVAQQNVATNPQPDTQQEKKPAAAASPADPGKVILDSQSIVIQKGTLAVPIAVGGSPAPAASQAPTSQPVSTQTSSAPNAQPASASSAPQAQPGPASAAAAPGNVILRSQPVVIQKGTLAVPIAVGGAPAPATVQAPAGPATAAQPPAQTQSPTAATPPPTDSLQSNADQQQPEPGAAPPPAPPGTAVLPTVTKKQREEAKRQFEAGVKLRKSGNLDEAFTKFTSASELDPTKLDYITAREFTREQLAFEALKRGNQAMLENNEIVAMAEFRRALEYDPTNNYALQRLRDAIPDNQVTDHPVSVVEQSVPIELRPQPQHHDFHFRGDSHSLLNEVGRAYGISVQLDDSVQSKHVLFDIQDVNFATAMRAANDVTKTFWVPLSSKQVLVLADNVENRRTFERLALRTFYVPDLTDQQLSEMTNSLRVLLNLRFIAMDKGASTVTIRAELPVLDAADKLIRSLTVGRPEVLLDVKVYAVSTSVARALGTALPTQFTMFNVGPSLLAGLGQNAQNLINQLIASGGINAANSTAISALLAQLGNSSTGSLLSQPFVVFGGGLTLFGLNAAGAGISPTFSLNNSDIEALEHLLLRASHNDPAVAKIGERYPIINATFAPIYNTSAIASVIGNQSYIAPFPSFTFEDLGLNLKATPFVHGYEDVTLKIELQIRSLGTQNVNGIPIINNREYSGEISVKDGESSVVTGMIDMDDSRSINGYPFLGQIPGLGYGASVHNKNVAEDELLVVITPHILRLADRTSFAAELPPSH